MLRRIMGIVVAFVLVASLMLPLAPVGAQDAEFDPGQQPVTTEETIPEAEPPADVDQPPIEEPVIDEPVAEEPAVEQPVEQAPPVDEPSVDEPVVDEPGTGEPAGEEPVAEEPSVDEPTEAAQTPEVSADEVDASADEGESGEVPAEDEDDVSDADDEEDSEATVISSASLACDGTLTFTIVEAGDETLSISFTNLHAPTMNRDMGSISFPVTEPGTFQVSISVDEWVDVFQADISSALASGIIGQAAAYGCITGEEQALGYGISNMTVTCTGAITFTVGAVEGGVSIQLFDGSTNPRTLLGSAGLGYIIDGGGEEQTIDFALPAGRFDSLVARAWSYNDWAPLDIAYATDCVDEEEPEPGTDVVVENLTVTCEGLISFDVTTPDPVTLEVAFFVPASAPGYRVSTEITASTGPQQVQLAPRSNGAFEWSATVSLGNEVLAYTTLINCPFRPANTLPGSNVTVPVAGGTVTFENVLEPGETIVSRLDEEFAPPLPAQYQGQVVIMVDLFTTAVIDGAATVCLPITPDVAADSENVRLLHYENGAWVDITTSVSGTHVCGVTSSFSPFAIIKLMGQEPHGPGEPSGPQGPGHHGPKSGGHHAHSGNGTTSGGTNLTGLPNTGSGPQAGSNGIQAMYFLLAALALMVAGGLRISATQTRGARSR